MGFPVLTFHGSVLDLRALRAETHYNKNACGQDNSHTLFTEHQTVTHVFRGILGPPGTLVLTSRLPQPGALAGDYGWLSLKASPLCSSLRRVWLVCCRADSH